MKTLFMLMLTAGLFCSSAAHAVVGQKVSGVEDCTKVMQATEALLKHDSGAGDAAPAASAPADGKGDSTTAK